MLDVARTSRDRISSARRIGGLAMVPIAAVFAVSACKEPEVAVAPPPIVEVMEISTSEAPLSSTIIGQLDSPQNVEIRARVEAFVDKALFTEGGQVKAGEILYELDKKPFLERLAAARGSLGEAEAALGKYEADVRRLRPLAENRAIPQQDLDNALASVDVGKAGVDTAVSRVESAKLDLGYCDVKAPISGLIGAKQVSIGDLVGKGDPTLLATISTLDPIWFYCTVSEVDYIKAEAKSRKLGKKVEDLPLTLLLSDGTEHPAQGKFVFIDRAVDVKTGTLRLRAEFPNPGKILRPGMFARVRADLGTLKETIQVPERTLVELQGRNFVWVVGPDNLASQRPVTLGDQVGSNFIVTDGLETGERIILEGVQKAREGALVNPLTAAQMAAMKSHPAPEEAPSKE